MEDIIAVKDYFKKLQRATIEEAELTLFSFKLVKKNRIADLFCCILALLPDSYKKALKTHSVAVSNRLSSVSAYKRLEKLLKRPFVLSPDLYLVRFKEVTTLIRTITLNIEKDVNTLEEY